MFFHIVDMNFTVIFSNTLILFARGVTYYTQESELKVQLHGSLNLK